MWLLHKSISKNCKCWKYIISCDDIVQAYAIEWKKYCTASGYANIICEYLNKLITKRDSSGGGGRSSKGPYQRQIIEAVKIFPFPYPLLLLFNV